jgi:hypothetical protein
LADRDAAVEDIAQVGEGADGELEGLERPDDGADGGGRGRGHGHEELVGPGAPDDPRKLVAGPENGQAVDPPARLGRVVVDEADRVVVVVGTVADVADDHLAGIASAVDEEAPAALDVAVMAQDAAREADAREEQHQEHGVDRVDGAGKGRDAEDPPGDDEKDDGTHGDAGQDVPRVGEARVPPQAGVETERDEDKAADDKEERKEREPDGQVPGRDVEVEAEEVGEVAREGDEEQLREDDDGTAVGKSPGDCGRREAVKRGQGGSPFSRLRAQGSGLRESTLESPVPNDPRRGDPGISFRSTGSSPCTRGGSSASSSRRFARC